MRFGELFSSIGIELPSDIQDENVSGIVTDSRKIIKNCIFICLCGSRYDGHDCIEEAAKAGAKVIVAEKVRGVCVGGAAIILVENTRHTASLLYDKWYHEPAKHLKVVGVTGTNGKTSVCHMLTEIFRNAGFRSGMIGTVGSFDADGKAIEGGGMTTPEPQELYRTLDLIRKSGAEYVFMEVSSHGLAHCRTDAIRFDTAVFTNISEDHLDFHKNFENYYKAKEKLFLGTQKALINVDNSYGKRLFRTLNEKGNCKILKSSSRSVGDFCALGAEILPEGCRYALKHGDEICNMFLPICGDFQIDNSLQAAAVALMHGIPIESICKALGALPVIFGRMEEVRIDPKQKFRIYIDYAHTPDALERLLKSVRAQRGDGEGRIILLFGCGGEREIEKRAQMGQIASRLSDLVIVTTDNPRGEDPEKIISDILHGIDKEKEFMVIKSRAEAIELAVQDHARDGDFLVLAGKGHECYQIDKNGKHDFDERKVLAKAFFALRQKHDKDF